MKRRKPIKRTPLKRSTKPIRRRSKKGALKDAQNARYKKTLPKVCCICGKYGNDLMHLLNKNVYPQHYTEERNLKIGCRECHNLYDNELSFRRLQKHLYEQICLFDKQSADQYFRTYIFND